jgi:hypothetical protein
LLPSRGPAGLLAGFPSSGMLVLLLKHVHLQMDVPAMDS